MIFVLNLDEATANALITNLQVAIRTVGYEASRTATPIITELLRQDAEAKKANTVPSQPAPSNDGGSAPQP